MMIYSGYHFVVNALNDEKNVFGGIITVGFLFYLFLSIVERLFRQLDLWQITH